MRGSKRLALKVALTSFAAFVLAAPGAGAVEIVDEIPVPPSGSVYTVSPEETIWQTSAGSVSIVERDQDDGSVIDSFEHGYGTNWTPRGLTYFNGRVYVADGLSPMRLVSWNAESPDTTDPERVTSDDQMNNRLGTNQAILRADPGGAGAVALGQSNKVATFNLADLDAAPYYPHSIFGAGISDPNGVVTAFQACAYSGGGVIIGTPDPDCGFYLGQPGSAPGQFGYATDSAFGDSGIYVLEYNENEVSFISLGGSGCPCASFDFPLPGGAGNGPLSIRRAPDTGNLLISSFGNRRIDEVTTTGEHVRSFGFGVETGQNQFETCESGCLPGIATATEPRSGFAQLDIVNGLLFAATPSDGSIQVISLSDENRVELKAKPKRVKKGAKTTLTAALSTCETGFKAQFQVKSGSTFDDLGQPKTVDDACEATKKVKITKKSAFRVISTDAGGAPLATSSNVTVKLKR